MKISVGDRVRLLTGRYKCREKLKNDAGEYFYHYFSGWFYMRVGVITEAESGFYCMKPDNADYNFEICDFQGSDIHSILEREDKKHDKT